MILVDTNILLRAAQQRFSSIQVIHPHEATRLQPV